MHFERMGIENLTYFEQKRKMNDFRILSAIEKTSPLNQEL